MDSESPGNMTDVKADVDLSVNGTIDSEIKAPSPVIRSRSRKARFNRSLVSAAVVAIAFVSLAGLYLLSVAPDLKQLSSSVWRSIDRTEQSPPPKSVPAIQPRDALADIPLSFRLELMATSATANEEMSRSFKHPVDRLCDYLGSLGRGKFVAMHNPIAEGQWVCTSDVLPAASHTASSSVFVWLRGAERRELDLFRLKINLTDPASSDAAKTLALTFLQKLHDKFDWDMPQALIGAVQNVHEASFVRYGVSYQVIREWSSVPRLNVVIQSADRSGILPTDSFVIDKPQNSFPVRPASTVRLKPSITAPSSKPLHPDPAPIENLMQ